MRFHINPKNDNNILEFPEVEEILRTSDARSFHKTIEGYSITPLFSLPSLAADLGIGELWVKDESPRFGLNSFKGLGASYAVHRYLQENPGQHTFCTATDGNHGRAVAWAARLFGQKAVIFVPGYTVAERIDNIKKQGAEVRIVEGHYDETVTAAHNAAKENNWVLVQDTAWDGYTKIPAWILAGYLTQFAEIDEQIDNKPYFDIVFLHAGVGSWGSAGLWYFHRTYGNKAPKSVIVEPAHSDGILQSMVHDELRPPLNPGHTIMAGLNCGIPSLISFPIFQKYADAFISIPDDRAKEAMRKLYYPKDQDKSIIAGETGAAGLAGLLDVLHNPLMKMVKEHLAINSSSKILVINTEGATDNENFKRIISGE